MTKWIIIALIGLGALLVSLGLKASGDKSQSADVRSGGSIPIVAGVLSIVLALLIAFIAFLVEL